jgi:hypothetical protein
VRQLRSFFVGAGDFESLQTYVLLLIGIKLFLRAEEVLTITLDFNFDADTQRYQIIHPGQIRSIAIRVKGKNDPVPCTLVLHCDDECPCFCPVRHLLVYIKMLGWKGGYLFPPKADLAAATGGDGMFDQHVTYSTWLAKMKGLMKNVLGRTVGGETTLGTHTLRKTGYLFAIWGCLKVLPNVHESKDFPDLLLSAILSSARHQSIQNAKAYARDATTLFELCQRERHSELHVVSRWLPNMIITHTSAESITVPSRHLQKPLPELASWYFEVVLGLVNDRSLSISRAINMAVAVEPQLESKERFLKMVQQHFPPGELAAGLSLFHRTMETTVLAGMSPLPPPCNNPLKLNASPVDPQDGGNNPKKRQRGEGKASFLEGYNKIRFLGSNKDKVATIVDFYKRADLRPSQFPEKERAWWFKNCSYVGWCVETCHAGNQEAFLTAIGGKKFHSSTYRCPECFQSKPSTLG